MMLTLHARANEKPGAHGGAPGVCVGGANCPAWASIYSPAGFAVALAASEMFVRSRARASGLVKLTNARLVQEPASTGLT